jgi:hypothetical protein
MTPRNGSLAFGSGHRLPTSGRINRGAGNPVWSENPIADTSFNLNYDLAPDGKGIVALMPAAENKGAQEAQNHQEHNVVFLENFLDELRRKVPVGK